MSVHSITGRVVDEANPCAVPDLVEMLEQMLEDARAGRLVALAGVIAMVGERGKMEIRLATHTNNWEIHDRLLARVGVLRTMMENDLLRNMGLIDIPHPGDRV